MKQMIDIRIGALSPPLHEQINEQAGTDLTAEDLEFEQKMVKSLVILNIHSILTEREMANASKRLVKKITAKASEILSQRKVECTSTST